MPAKKRTDQTKRTSPTSTTTSTSHTSADQHHRLRHSGPSIATRASVGAAPSKPLSASAHPEPTPESTPTPKGLREKKLLAEVSPPGARTPFTKFLYALLFIVLLLLVWYTYGMVVLLERLKEEVGWWGIIVGDPGGMPRWETWKGFGSGWGGGEGGRAEAQEGGDLERSLNALADALGISPIQVASAVKPLVPQASLTSIASKTEETGGSKAVRILFEDTSPNDKDRVDTTRVAEEFVNRLKI
ncbi:hypothetical protein HD554DRAFT_2175656 [Boletus coccyginus]|nr:hypothetical protein HD554DRAFT_2175656 [Boletus coccyginus]